MKVNIRKWELADAKDLATAISNKKVQDNLRDGLPYPYTEQDGKEFISAMLDADENDTFAFAITADEKVVGSIGAFRQTNIHNKTAELGYYIAEEYWGKGIGSALMERIISFSRDAGYKSIFLDVRADNERAIALYSKFGFLEIGLYKDYFNIEGKFFDAKLMVLYL